jgi:hypothetical protein
MTFIFLLEPELRLTDSFSCFSLGVNILWGRTSSMGQNLGNPPLQEEEQERGQGDAPFGTTMYALSSISVDIQFTSGDDRTTTSAVERSDTVCRMFVNGQRKSLGSRLTRKIG